MSIHFWPMVEADASPAFMLSPEYFSTLHSNGLFHAAAAKLSPSQSCQEKWLLQTGMMPSHNHGELYRPLYCVIL